MNAWANWGYPAGGLPNEQATGLSGFSLAIGQASPQVPAILRVLKATGRISSMYQSPNNIFTQEMADALLSQPGQHLALSAPYLPERGLSGGVDWGAVAGQVLQDNPQYVGQLAQGAQQLLNVNTGSQEADAVLNALLKTTVASKLPVPTTTKKPPAATSSENTLLLALGAIVVVAVLMRKKRK